MIIPYNGTEVEFKIPDGYKNIALNISGGADGAIILYTLAKYITENNIDITVDIYTMSTEDRHRWHSKFSNAQIDFVSRKFLHKAERNFLRHHIILNGWERDNGEYRTRIADLQKEHYKQGYIDLVVNGKTAIPVEDIIVDGINLTQLPHHYTDRHGYKHPEFWKYGGDPDMPQGYSPFVNQDKRFIAYLYDYFDIRDEYFSLTRSCETFDLELIDNNIHCGECWDCLERKWAFGEM